MVFHYMKSKVYSWINNFISHGKVKVQQWHRVKSKELDTPSTSELKYMFKPLVEASMKKRKNFLVDYVLSAQDIALLQKGFPELNVLVTGKVNHPHAMAAVTRNCSEAFILRMIGYDNGVTSLIEGKIFLVDIGANYVRHIKRGRYNIHCCVPVMDVRDSARETERRSELLNMMSKGKISKKTYEDYIHDGTRRCMKKSQDCCIKAQYGMLIHAHYDLSFEEMKDVCDAHEFDMVWSVMIFDTKIFYRDEGIIDDLKVTFKKRNGKIYFNFIGDPSMNYVHNFDDYMQLVTRQVMVTKKGRVYLMEKNHVLICLLDILIVRG